MLTSNHKVRDISSVILNCCHISNVSANIDVHSTRLIFVLQAPLPQRCVPVCLLYENHSIFHAPGIHHGMHFLHFCRLQFKNPMHSAIPGQDTKPRVVRNEYQIDTTSMLRKTSPNRNFASLPITFAQAGWRVIRSRSAHGTVAAVPSK